MKISLLINMKMPFGIFILLAEKISCSAEYDKSFTTSRSDQLLGFHSLPIGFCRFTKVPIKVKVKTAEVGCSFSTNLILLSSIKGSPLGSNFFLFRAKVRTEKSFSFRVHPFSENSYILDYIPFQKGIDVPETKQEVTKLVSFVKNGRKATIQSP